MERPSCGVDGGATDWTNVRAENRLKMADCSSLCFRILSVLIRSKRSFAATGEGTVFAG